MKIKRVQVTTLLIFCFTIIVNSQIPVDSLIGYWPFNGNANDQSGHGNNGVVYGATLTTDRFGLLNSAFEFNGTSSRINLNANLHSSGFPLTYSFWVKHDEPDQGTLFSGKINRPDGFSVYYGLAGIFVWYNGALGFIFGDGLGSSLGNRRSFHTSEGILNDSCWYHVVLVADDFTNGGTMYVNGDTVDLVYYTGSASQVDFTQGNYTLGAGRGNDNTFTTFYKGVFDDIVIYNRAITYDEVLELYQDSSHSDILYDTIIVIDTIPVYDTITVTDTITEISVVYDTITTYDTISVTDTLIIDLSLDIHELGIDSKILIYPNPASDILHINISNFEAITNYRIQIISMSGKTIFETLINQDHYSMDLTTITESGLYNLILMDDELITVVVRKIVIE